MRLRWLILPVLLTACSSLFPPAAFLRTDDKPWNDWMETIIDVDVANVPLGTLATRPAFEGLNIVLNGVDPDYRIALQAKHVTRRQALWQLANQYGLALTFGPAGQSPVPVVVITNSESRHENRPLN